MFLDSNIFLEVELSERHSEECKQLLRMIKDGLVNAAITDFHIDSIVVIMEQYGKRWKDLEIFLSSLLLYKGLTLFIFGVGSRIQATKIMKEHDLDFDDALLLQGAREMSVDTIVSYDKHLDSIKGIKRLTPEQILKERKSS